MGSTLPAGRETTSSFTWLDYSERERRKMLDVVDQFRERDTRDELGVGSIRDAFAELLFPGTSTIQTRAKYFLFVPWIYIGLEKRKIPSSEVTRRARREEVTLINGLAESDDPTGTIGIEAKARLKRFASSIYWHGLAVWGVRLFHGSQHEYHRCLDRFYASASRVQRADDGEPVGATVPRNWHPGIPDPPGSFPKEASFVLSASDSDYLRERILTHCPGTLLALLVESLEKGVEVDFPWQHPDAAECPAHIKQQLLHGRNFSEVIHGAALLYNLMLAEESGKKELGDQYRGELQTWASRIAERAHELSGWRRDEFWCIANAAATRIPLRTRHFANAWMDLALSGDTAHSIAECGPARRLIQEREKSLKGPLARLANPRALELWSGAAGTAQLDYRWPVVQTIVTDINGPG